MAWFSLPWNINLHKTFEGRKIRLRDYHQRQRSFRKRRRFKFDTGSPTSCRRGPPRSAAVLRWCHKKCPLRTTSLYRNPSLNSVNCTQSLNSLYRKSEKIIKIFFFKNIKNKNNIFKIECNKTNDLVLLGSQCSAIMIL